MPDLDQLLTRAAAAQLRPAAWAFTSPALRVGTNGPRVLLLRDVLEREQRMATLIADLANALRAVRQEVG